MPSNPTIPTKGAAKITSNNKEENPSQKTENENQVTHLKNKKDN